MFVGYIFEGDKSHAGQKRPLPTPDLRLRRTSAPHTGAAAERRHSGRRFSPADLASLMIARIWQGRVRRRDLAAYRDYVVRTGLADYKSTPGNRGAYLLTRADGDAGFILTLSFWDSYEAISEFAGADYTRARYYAQDERFLLDFPETVDHYEVD